MLPLLLLLLFSGVAGMRDFSEEMQGREDLLLKRVSSELSSVNWWSISLCGKKQGKMWSQKILAERSNMLELHRNL